jgi:hypothetical protein
MKRTTITRLILAALVLAVLLIAALGLPGVTNSSAEQTTAGLATAESAAITRLPRPHPASHLSLPPGINLLNPRPHPTSHIDLAPNRP